LSADEERENNNVTKDLKSQDSKLLQKRQQEEGDGAGLWSLSQFSVLTVL
jgi:hypothetical protein